MKFILGRKIGMTQMFDQNEHLQPVTLVQAGPCVVTQIKKNDKEAYEAIQLGFSDDKKKAKRDSKEEKSTKALYRFLKEFRNRPFEFSPEGTKAKKEKNVEAAEWLKTYKVGDKITVSAFAANDVVHVRSITKGKGYAGPVKLHGFSGGPASHGHRHELKSHGSMGSRFPQHTRKGKRLWARMGANPRTTKNLNVLWIDEKENLMAISGSFAGIPGALVEIYSYDSSEKK